MDGTVIHSLYIEKIGTHYAFLFYSPETSIQNPIPRTQYPLPGPGYSFRKPEFLRQSAEGREGVLDGAVGNTVRDTEISRSAETAARDQEQIVLGGSLDKGDVVRYGTFREEIEGALGLHHLEADLG